MARSKATVFLIATFGVIFFLHVNAFLAFAKADRTNNSKVNLYTGDVSVAPKIISLPGPKGLDVNVSLAYSSASHKMAEKINAESPTGILGLGWSLTKESIVRDTNGTGNEQDDSFFLLSNGSRNQLIKTGSDVEGDIYKLKEYKFWKIRNNTSKNQWTIVKENGFKYIYGGGVKAEADGSKTSSGDSIEWGVKWGNWIGSSMQTAGQEQFPIVWHLTTIQNIWGQEIHLYYDQVRKRVGTALGSNDLSYTQAAYLSKIVGASGETVELNYEEKDTDEYVVPHVPDTDDSQTNQNFLTVNGALNSSGLWNGWPYLLPNPQITLTVKGPDGKLESAETTAETFNDRYFSQTVKLDNPKNPFDLTAKVMTAPTSLLEELVTYFVDFINGLASATQVSLSLDKDKFLGVVHAINAVYQEGKKINGITLDVLFSILGKIKTAVLDTRAGFKTLGQAIETQSLESVLDGFQKVADELNKVDTIIKDFNKVTLPAIKAANTAIAPINIKIDALNKLIKNYKVPSIGSCPGGSYGSCKSKDSVCPNGTERVCKAPLVNGDCNSYKNGKCNAWAKGACNGWEQVCDGWAKGACNSWEQGGCNGHASARCWKCSGSGFSKSCGWKSCEGPCNSWDKGDCNGWLKGLCNSNKNGDCNSWAKGTCNGYEQVCNGYEQVCKAGKKLVCKNKAAKVDVCLACSMEIPHLPALPTQLTDQKLDIIAAAQKTLDDLSTTIGKIRSALAPNKYFSSAASSEASEVLKLIGNLVLKDISPGLTKLVGISPFGTSIKDLKLSPQKVLDTLVELKKDIDVIGLPNPEKIKTIVKDSNLLHASLKEAVTVPCLTDKKKLGNCTYLVSVIDAILLTPIYFIDTFEKTAKAVSFGLEYILDALLGDPQQTKMLEKTFSGVQCDPKTGQVFDAQNNQKNLYLTAQGESGFKGPENFKTGLAILNMTATCAVPSLNRNGYQDRFETKYLDSINVFSAPEGDNKSKKLRTVNFNYGFLGTDTLKKRLLKGISHTNPEGKPISPSQDFIYWGEDAADGVQVSVTDNSGSFSKTNKALYGALKKVVAPLGATKTYFYSKNEIPKAKRALENVSIKPYWNNHAHTYFGSDYMVLTWFEPKEDGGDFHVSAYQWLGKWVTAQIEGNDAEELGSFPLDKENIGKVEVVLQDDFIMVVTPGNDNSLQIFRKDPLRNGIWKLFSPSVKVTAEKFKLAAGERFVALLDTESGVLHRYSWNGSQWKEDSFSIKPESGSGMVYGMTANKNFIFTVSTPSDQSAKPQLQFHTIDAMGQWLSPKSWQAPANFFIDLPEEKYGVLGFSAEIYANKIKEINLQASGSFVGVQAFRKIDGAKFKIPIRDINILKAAKGEGKGAVIDYGTLYFEMIIDEYVHVAYKLPGDTSKLSVGTPLEQSVFIPKYKLSFDPASKDITYDDILKHTTVGALMQAVGLDVHIPQVGGQTALHLSKADLLDIAQNSPFESGESVRVQMSVTENGIAIIPPPAQVNLNPAAVYKRYFNRYDGVKWNNQDFHNDNKDQLFGPDLNLDVVSEAGQKILSLFDYDPNTSTWKNNGVQFNQPDIEYYQKVAQVVQFVVDQVIQQGLGILTSEIGDIEGQLIGMGIDAVFDIIYDAVIFSGVLAQGFEEKGLYGLNYLVMNNKVFHRDNTGKWNWSKDLLRTDESLHYRKRELANNFTVYMTHKNLPDGKSDDQSLEDQLTSVAVNWAESALVYQIQNHIKLLRNGVISSKELELDTVQEIGGLTTKSVKEKSVGVGSKKFELDTVNKIAVLTTEPSMEQPSLSSSNAFIAYPRNEMCALAGKLITMCGEMTTEAEKTFSLLGYLEKQQFPNTVIDSLYNGMAKKKQSGLLGPALTCKTIDNFHTNLINSKSTCEEFIEKTILPIKKLSTYTLLPGLQPKVLASDFTYAKSFNLYRVVNDGFKEALEDYAVSKVVVDDGFEKRYTDYVYNTDTAEFDPSGATAFYNQVTVVPSGFSDSPDYSNGITQHFFLNGGLDGNSKWSKVNTVQLCDSTGTCTDETTNNLTLVNGLPYLTRVCESNSAQKDCAKEIASTFKEYTVFEKALGEKGRKGYYLRPTHTVSTRDTVESAVDLNYNSNGLLTNRTSYNYDVSGKKEVNVKTLVYGSEQYPELHALNILKPIVHRQTKTTSGNDPPIVTHQSVTTWKNWGTKTSPQWAPYQNFVARSNQPGDFDWAGGVPKIPAHWIRTRQIINRDPSTGRIQDIQDVNGVYHSDIYDVESRFRIASFSNASVRSYQAGYLGFESYESSHFWTSSGAPSKDRHTGIRSLQGNPVHIQPTSFSPREKNTAYIVSAWFKPVVGKTCQLGFGNQTVATQVGNEGWQYLESVTLSPSSTNVPSAECSQGGAIDDIRFGPVDSPFMANVYDPDYTFVTARLGTNGDVNRFIYDDTQRRIAVVGPDEQVSHLSTQHFSRRLNGSGVKEGQNFVLNDPNSQYHIVARQGGRYFSFNDGTTQGWSAGTVVDSKLQLSGKSTAALLNSSKDAFGIRVQLNLPSSENERSQRIGLVIGEWEVRYDASQGGYHIYANGKPRGVWVKGPLAADWVLVWADGSIFLIADGKSLVRDSAFKGTVLGKFQISVYGDEKQKTLFDNVLILRDPQVAVSYSNGTGKVHQAQRLETGKNVIVSETVYDGLGRPAVHTKPAKVTGFLGFKNDFVKKPFDWKSGLMKGTVADYYSSKGKGFSDDAGFPYSRVEYENNPLSRRKDIASPGKDFAVDGALTMARQYGLDTNAEVFLNDLGIPSDENNFYSILTDIKPFESGDSISSIQVRDLQKHQIAQRTQGKTLSTTASYGYGYTSDGGLNLITNPPNFYDPPSGQKRDPFKTTASKNILGDLIERTTPDSGTTKYIYDSSGKVRFTLDAEGAAQTPNRIVYWKYDPLERVVENGTFSQKWNPVDLQNQADHHDLPKSPKTWQTRWQYDINAKGDSTRLKGHLYTVFKNTNDDETAEIKETFHYDLQGNVTAMDTVVNEYASGKTFTISYNYDHLGSLTGIDSGSESTTYTYDLLGRVASIGTKDDADFFAAYTYNANGSVHRETLNNGGDGKNQVQRAYSYNSPGWLIAITDNAFFKEQIDYKDDKGNYRGGNVVQSAFDFIGAAFPTKGPKDYAYQFKYDDFGRLVSAENGVEAQWNLKVGDGKNGYDANGNILNLGRGEATQTYVYKEGTNQVQTTDDKNKFAYDPNGNVTESSSKKIGKIAYEPVTNLTSTIQKDDLTFAFQYDGANRRILKNQIQNKQSQSKTLYLNGPHSKPLVERQSSGGTDSVKQHVYGPTGLIATREGKNAYFVSKDHLGSVRVVFDSNKQVKAYFNYLPFGGLMQDNSSPEAVSEPYSYRFTGQEYDSEFGLHNYRARFYDSDLGRFYSPDPASQFSSPYEYAGNNPINNVDPSGKISFGFIEEFFESFLVKEGAEEVGSLATSETKELGEREGESLAASGAESTLNKGCSSFTANTKVATEEGLLDIQDLKIGNRVWSFNAATGYKELNEVTQLFTRAAKDRIQITLGDSVIETTSKHPFRVKDKGWIPAEELKVGDLLWTSDGHWQEIEGAEKLGIEVRVYNFEVKEVHNYFVSKDEVLAHNLLAACAVNHVNNGDRPSWRQATRTTLIAEQAVRLDNDGTPIIRSGVSGYTARLDEMISYPSGWTTPNWNIDHIIPWQYITEAAADPSFTHNFTWAELRDISNDTFNLQFLTRGENVTHAFEPSPSVGRANARWYLRSVLNFN